MRLRLEPLLQCGYQSRFADARLSREQDHAAFTPQSLVPAAYEQLQFLFTPYQWSKAGLVLRLEPALHRARGEYLPCLDRLGQPLSTTRPRSRYSKSRPVSRRVFGAITT